MRKFRPAVAPAPEGAHADRQRLALSAPSPGTEHSGQIVADRETRCRLARVRHRRRSRVATPKRHWRVLCFVARDALGVSRGRVIENYLLEARRTCPKWEPTRIGQRAQHNPSCFVNAERRRPRGLGRPRSESPRGVGAPALKIAARLGAPALKIIRAELSRATSQSAARQIAGRARRSRKRRSSAAGDAAGEKVYRGCVAKGK